MIKLRYGNTNTFYVPGESGGLLVDTDYAGTLQAFYRAIKTAHIDLRDISYVIATHYHPDHMGLISSLMDHGIKLVLMESQISSVHFSDRIFQRDRRLRYSPIDETKAAVIRHDESRTFLLGIGIHGEILHTPSHSPDSVSLLLDSGECMVGDLEPLEYLDTYRENPSLEQDWNTILRRKPKRILYAHVNEKVIP